VAAPLSATDVAAELDARDLLALVADVCRMRGVTLADLCGRVRARSVSYARQEVWWRLRTDPERYFSLLEIARLFGRDHTTVLAGVAAHERRTSRQRRAWSRSPRRRSR
jgi:chromosomal replication initiation ATPase DnaA